MLALMGIWFELRYLKHFQAILQVHWNGNMGIVLSRLNYRIFFQLQNIILAFSHYLKMAMELVHIKFLLPNWEVCLFLLFVRYNVTSQLILEPENLPPQPEILKNDGTKMEVKLTAAVNNNGPITAYRIIVVRSDDNQGFQQDNVFSYEEAQKHGLSYYISAEIKPLVK